jgi:sulfopyruvate decarboxylase TPP-binding subunit
MLSAAQALQICTDLGITHIVWVPDSVLGRWEGALELAPLRLIRVCREGEAWPLAAGLYAGGARPLILMQTTGLFESGDALRNAVFDLQAPLYAWIGVRNWLNTESPDSARRFAKPIIDAWHVDHIWIQSPDDLPALVQHYTDCQSGARAGLALISEGAG